MVGVGGLEREFAQTHRDPSDPGEKLWRGVWGNFTPPILKMRPRMSRRGWIPVVAGLEFRARLPHGWSLRGRFCPFEEGRFEEAGGGTAGQGAQTTLLFGWIAARGETLWEWIAISDSRRMAAKE